MPGTLPSRINIYSTRGTLPVMRRTYFCKMALTTMNSKSTGWIICSEPPK